MKAVILAGGKGARLAPYTKIIPKPLMPIGDMPILEVLLRQLKAAGIEDVILTVGHLAGLLRAFFNDGHELGLNIMYSYEKEPLGTAGPLGVINNLDETFLVMNGDVLTSLDLLDLIDFHKKNRSVATIAMHRRTVPIDLGVIQYDGENRIMGYLEKPTMEYMVSMGIYVFEPSILAYIRPKEYLDFPDLVHKLLGHREKVVGFPFNGYWQDLGRPDDYEQASQDFDTMRSIFLKEEVVYVESPVS